MKNQFSIIMFCLLGLCTLACILLIVVIINTGGNFSFDKLFKMKNNVSSLTVRNDAISIENDDKIIIPDRFKAIHDIRPNSATTESDTLSKSIQTEMLPSLPKSQRYFPRYSCHEIVSALVLKQLLADNRLFCQKSDWSKEWSNPTGKGIRMVKEGLLLQDSLVIDSLTNVMWQRFSTSPALSFNKTDSAIIYLNAIKWQGFDNWRLPKIEELMATLLPRKNRAGLFLPSGWNCNAQNIWSCNFVSDSLSVQWVWVVRTALGRCNVGHPDTPRSLLAVRSM
jgi:hypothetical protein